MQPVRLVCDVVNTLGTIGYSCLIERGNGAERTTVLYLRDKDGFCKWAVIVPSETLQGAM
jgi:hypothetical protein